MKALGAKMWAIAEGYIPPSSTGDTRQLTSHETVCLLNAGARDAHVAITVFFAEREPVGPLPASLSQTSRLSCSTPGSIRVSRRWPC